MSPTVKSHNTLTSIQDKQIKAEVEAKRKHGNTLTARKVIFAARTRSQKAIMGLGFNFEEARAAVTDAADMAMLELASKVKP